MKSSYSNFSHGNKDGKGKVNYKVVLVAALLVVGALFPSRLISSAGAQTIGNQAQAHGKRA